MRANVADPSFRALVGETHDDPARLASRIAAVRYRFDGPKHQIAGLAAVARRGYAACADAAAALLAWAELRGERATLIVEGHAERPDYAHVRVKIRGVELDPYADRSLVPGVRVGFDSTEVRAHKPCGCAPCSGAPGAAVVVDGGQIDWGATIAANQADRCKALAATSANACPIPSGLLNAAKTARQLAQPIAWVGAHVLLNAYLIMGPFLLVLWPVLLLNLVLMELPYLLLALFASCGNPGEALRSEATTARESLQMLRNLYETNGAVRLIPFAADFYNAAGLALVALVPIIDGRLPTATELEAGEGAMRTVSKSDARIASAAKAAEAAGIEPSTIAKDRARKRSDAIVCASSSSSQKAPGMNRNDYLKATAESLLAAAADKASDEAKSRRIADTFTTNAAPGVLEQTLKTPNDAIAAQSVILAARAAWVKAGKPINPNVLRSLLAANGFPIAAFGSLGPTVIRGRLPTTTGAPGKSVGGGFAIPAALAAAFFFLR